MRIEEMNPYDKFIISCKSEATKKEYTAALNRFMSQYEIKEYEDILKLSVKELEGIVIDYTLSLKKRDLSKGYVTQALAAIKRFLFMNDVVLNWNKIMQYKGEFTKKQNKGYSHEQIEKLLQICDIRTRAVVLIFCSVGIRAGALPELRIKSLKRFEDSYQFNIYEGFNEQYISFCTPECAVAIDNYLSFRKRQGEILNDQSYLIRTEFDINDLEQIRMESNPVATSTIRSILWRYMVKSGIREVSHDKHQMKNIPEIHGFRKFYSTQLVNAELNTEKRWMLEGHNLKGNDNSYVKPTVQDLYDEYSKAINLLTINPENRLKKRVQELEVDADYLISMMKRVEDLENMTKGLVTKVREGKKSGRIIVR